MEPKRLSLWKNGLLGIEKQRGAYCSVADYKYLKTYLFALHSKISV